MRILVTAGNTQTPLDKVRCITNIFTGRTGATVAARAADRGHDVTLLTSHPDVLDCDTDVCVRTYRSFEDLENLMAEEIPEGDYDAIVHAAAVSDYHAAGVFAPMNGKLEDVSAGKVKSQHPELWIRLVPAPKLIDKIRTTWGFQGTLVKFKLEVGVTDAELLATAERSRAHSGADLMSANTLEGMHEWAYVGAGENYRHVPRTELALALIDEVERLHESRSVEANLVGAM